MTNIYEAVQEFRRALLRRERDAAMKLVRACGIAYERLSTQLGKSQGKMEAARVAAQQRRAVNQALADSERLLLAAIEQAPDGIKAEFNRLNKSAVEDLVGFLGDGSPLNTLHGRLAPEVRQIFEQGLINGVIQGLNPRAVAREIRKGLNGNLTRALKIARTETLRAYREASRRSYLHNSDLLEGWIWLSALNSRTCRACIAPSIGS